MSHLCTTWQHETAQGDLLDSPGVGAIEIRHKYDADQRQRRQEAPMCDLATPAWIFDFFCAIIAVGVILGHPVFVPYGALSLGVAGGRDSGDGWGTIIARPVENKKPCKQHVRGYFGC